MNKRIRRIVEMGDRIVEMAPQPGLDPTAQITTLFTQASAVVSSLKGRGRDQATGTGMFRGGSKQCREVAGEIREAMLEISGIARVLKPTDLPGAKEVFRMPRANASFQTLLAAARHFAREVEPHRALFVVRSLPESFVDDLKARIASFEIAIGQKASGRATLVGGTSGLESEGKVLLGIVQELRAILRVHLKAKPALLEAWQSAARVEADHRPASRQE